MFKPTCCYKVLSAKKESLITLYLNVLSKQWIYIQYCCNDHVLLCKKINGISIFGIVAMLRWSKDLKAIWAFHVLKHQSNYVPNIIILWVMSQVGKCGHCVEKAPIYIPAVELQHSVASYAHNNFGKLHAKKVSSGVTLCLETWINSLKIQ